MHTRIDMRSRFGATITYGQADRVAIANPVGRARNI